MPTETKSPNPMKSATKPPKPKASPPTQAPPVCFSFAAYAKTLIHRLRSLNVAVSTGLTDAEISAVESLLNFSFPPDLRSILQVGLPVGPHFPNWRVRSTQQLRILLNLPALYLSKKVTRNGFWVGSWGPRPKNDDAALSLVKKVLEHAPVLVPVYGNYYVPFTTPNLSGNPVFHVDGDGVRVLNFDVAGFFQRLDCFLQSDSNVDRFDCFINDRILGRGDEKRAGNLPLWAAAEARRVEFWTEVAERGSKRVTAFGKTRGWWSVVADDGLCMGLRACLDEAYWNLREGGWREEEVKEMMMMMDGSDELPSGVHGFLTADDVKEEVRQRVEILSYRLLSAGWSREDVEYTLDVVQDHGFNGRDFVIEAKSCVVLRHPNQTSCSMEEEDQQARSSVTLMHLLSLEA